MNTLKHKNLSISIGLCILVISACKQENLNPEITENLPQNPTTAINPLPTQDADLTVLIGDATLFRTDFESGFPNGLYIEDQGWQIMGLDDENSAICNLPSNDWTSILFGKAEWDNYTISLKILLKPGNDDPHAEVYFRINREIVGYRASISNHEWAGIDYYSPSLNLAGAELDLTPGEWVHIDLTITGDKIVYTINNELVLEARDDRRLVGAAGVGAGPYTELCVDDIHVWALDSNGLPTPADNQLIINDIAVSHYSIQEKVNNKPTIPVFYPWPGNCEQNSWFYFDCDSSATPYSLVWISSGTARDIESIQPDLSPSQTVFMRSDDNTLYLISEEWHYWNLGWRYLSPDSKFYLDETFQFHIDSEYGDTKVINFTHSDWPDLMARKAINFQEAGFDGLMLDWWHDGAGNGRSQEIVQDARLAIIQEIRKAAGEDFILMGNVNWATDDPTSAYLSGVFLELWKPDPAGKYQLEYSDEDQAVWDPSLERMEDLLLYWDQHLAWPKIIAFEPWKITTGDYLEDRYSEENYQYAKLFTAMALVIPENGYMLYADNNDDWDGGDHQHAYYDFYQIDFGKAVSDMIKIIDGGAYKIYEDGLIAYNRTSSKIILELLDGRDIIIEPLTGLFLEN
jgi:hypothetical protein